MTTLQRDLSVTQRRLRSSAPAPGARDEADATPDAGGDEEEALRGGKPAPAGGDEKAFGYLFDSFLGSGPFALCTGFRLLLALR